MPMRRYAGNLTQLLALYLLFSYLTTCAAASPHEKDQNAEIAGEILTEIPEGVAFPEIAGKTVPNKTASVYLFNWEESRFLRQLLEKLENDISKANQPPPDCDVHCKSDLQWIVEKRMDDIYEEVTNSILARSTKPDQNGQFRFTRLKVGKRYVVVATELQYEQGVLLLYEILGPLKLGNNKVRLVDRW